MPQQALNVVFAIDDLYLPGVVATARSVRRGAGERTPIRFHVIDAGLSPAGRGAVEERLGPLGEVTVHQVPDRLVMPQHKWFTSATLGRLHLGSVIPEDVARVLYLDADTLVLEDPSRLYHTDPGPGGLAAVVNEVGPTRSLVLSEDGTAEQREHGAAPPGYFNAGVLLVDMNVWRAEDMTGRGIRLFERYGRTLRDLDQAVLNILFSGRWRSLPMKWNKMIEHRRLGKFGNGRLDYLTRREGIVHYVGQVKPWHEGFPQNPLRALYAEFAAPAPGVPQSATGR
ncbi:glycosyltransferase family 8 protein [Streptomyces hoynatensis]|uniref:Glycosyltransferase family 8 protein n=1 Tax=Streptomyces hoynatensis TaxID=1141874 RepID=A0A3A9Z9D9_9ACTN|nr:glycosyltransferase family 8 protein [Streptomyces hoynatensis]RKN44905.1 glycosyltransferase family 8 protein [Streptomyces hoynatensis]